MSHNFASGKRKRKSQYAGVHDAEEGALVLSGDAAQVDYEDTVPVWKQEVTDERGRKRLHGAFTGGFSAGYFNTVGSKEGWTPSTFISSRNAKHKGVEKTVLDFMDEEDLADIENDRQLRIRSEQQAKEEVQQERISAQEDQNSTVKAQKQIEARTNEDSDRSALVTKSVMPKLPSARGGAKALSLLGEDDEVDGFDIGPKIKYDKSLAKKKKKTGATAQHTFTRKIVRNPEPEPEVYRRPSSSPQRSSALPTERNEQRLLPSIGNHDERAATTSVDPATGVINADRLAQITHVIDSHRRDGDHHATSNPVPPWRQNEPVSDAKVPPWRRPASETEALKVQLPSVGRQVAILALQSTFTPYPQNAEKHARYRKYLEVEATSQEDEQHNQGDLDPDTWLAECDEFKKCALMYKPMTGAMNKKFTSATTGPVTSDTDRDGEGASGIWENRVSSQVQAAREGKFGFMTRTTEPWTPARLLCKRLNVVPVSSAGQNARKGRSDEPEVRGSEINRQAVEQLMKSVNR